MTDGQFDNLFKLIDADQSGAMNPMEMPYMINAYEEWLYSKQYMKTMEDLYSDAAPKDEQAIDVKVPWLKYAL